ncbi:MAG: 2-amino-4-hydroxy-6-hydroxymethyldihydropteridine diphosphokinase [Bacteroidetes bacterium]|nr:2-amino-4-hydroxy-6-hydroxymethyldihydropteridine diphosphokinase [Bacteroidota bacterium]MBL6943266.1 2-amino-4-hydroxy-6-hydroxymethyldihydropteridine diphosphokinase [Bacteroidales bacterium]
MNQVFLLLGSNIEPRIKYLEEAEKKISKYIGNIVRWSAIYESEPLGFSANTTFLNRVLLVYCKLSAIDILYKILDIEQEMGRIRSSLGYSSRTIDIDILYFNNDIIKTENITIPHPRLHKRKFTLKPLSEIAPHFIHPVLNHNNKMLLDNCSDDSEVDIYKFQQTDEI